MDNGAACYQRYLDGDDSGIVDLIRDYKDGLMLYLNGITGNINLAEELMEDTFFKLATKKPSFNGKCSFKTWLYTIGRNAAIDGMRKRSKISDQSFDEYTDLADEESVEREYIREEQKITLHKALRSLAADYRQVLYLVYFEEFSADDTARIMRKTKKQIGNLLFRAKNSLKKQLEKEGFKYEII